MKKLNSLLFFGLTSFVILTSCGTTKISCGDGRTAISYKNPEKRYPSFVKSNENKFKATISVLDKVKLSDIDASTKTSVTELRDKLNNESSRFEIIAKSMYFKFNQDPCGQNEEYYKLLARLTDLESLKANLENSIKSGGIGGVDDAKVKKSIEDFKVKANPITF